jgi:hypothetical protein
MNASSLIDRIFFVPYSFLGCSAVCLHVHIIIPSGTGYNARSICVYDLCIMADVFPHFQQELHCVIVASTVVEGVLIRPPCALITNFWINKFEPRLVTEGCTLATMFPCFGLPLNFVCMFLMALFQTLVCVFMTTLCISNHQLLFPRRLVFFKRKPHMVLSS